MRFTKYILSESLFVNKSISTYCINFQKCNVKEINLKTDGYLSILVTKLAFLTEVMILDYELSVNQRELNILL